VRLDGGMGYVGPVKIDGVDMRDISSQTLLWAFIE
jgi:hypothetical protein